MAEANKNAIQTPSAAPAPEPADDRIQLPPPRKPERATPEQIRARIGRLDALLALVAMGFAFLVASMPVRNSDFWMHLATGRALVQGDAGPTTDPFAHTTEGIRWVNHAWLFDVLLYGAHQALGGPGLVVLKALLIAALAGLLMATRRPGQSLWAPAVGAWLAALVMAPRLLHLQPTLASLLLLGLTFWLLQKSASSDRATRLWALPALCALWVNLDAWFFLGPAAIALYFLGDFLQSKIDPADGEDLVPSGAWPHRLAVLAACVVATLASPSHVHGLTLPWPLVSGGALDALKEDRQFQSLSASLLGGWDQYWQGAVGKSIGGAAYLVLLLVGLVSFALNLDGRRWSRLLVWLGFAGLSAAHARAIPYFAVVAGPITALNLLDYTRRQYGLETRTERNWREWSLGGRTLTLFVGVLSLLMAWPGWLTLSTTNPAHARHVGWAIEPDAGYVAVAQRLRTWRQEGKLQPTDRVFNASPDIANYWAWFCPEEKGFIDHRFALFGGVAEDYLRARRALMLEDKDPLGSLHDVFRKHGVNHLVLAGSVVSGRADSYAILLSDPVQWPMLHQDGRATVFGWIDPGKGKVAPRAPSADPLKLPPAMGRFVGMGRDVDALAYGPNLPESARAPAEPPQEVPQRREWWHYWLKGTRPTSSHAEDAAVNLAYFSLVHQQHVLPSRMRLWQCAGIASMVGAGALPTGSLSLPGSEPHRGGLALHLYAHTRLDGARAEVFQRSQDDGPPAAILLAIRAARRAIKDNPYDPVAYSQLASAYRLLNQRTRERNWAENQPALVGGRPLLAYVRQVQIVTALERAVTIDPKFLAARSLLAQVYGEMGYLDMRLKHMQELLRISRGLGADPGAEEETERQLNQFAEEVTNLEDLVTNRRNDYEVRAQNRPPLQKAQLALERGLGEQALQVLLESDAVQFGAAGARMQLDLLLTLGRLEAIKEADFLNEEAGKGIPEYELYRMLVAAADGDYATADRMLGDYQKLVDQAALSPALEQALLGGKKSALTGSAALAQAGSLWIATQILKQVPNTGPVPYAAAQLAMRFYQDRDLETFLGHYYRMAHFQSALHALRGLLHLESGDTRAAAAQLRLAMGREPGLIGRPIAERYLPLLEAQAK